MKLPKTDSIRELAEFWDNHDVADFTDELVEVSERVFARRPGTAVTVPLTASERSALRDLARISHSPSSRDSREWPGCESNGDFATKA